MLGLRAALPHEEQSVYVYHVFGGDVMAVGVRTFDPAALRRWRRAVPRYDRALPGLSHDDLAARIGTTRAAVIWYEQGRKLPGPGRLVALARALGVQPQELTSSSPAQSTLYDLRVWAGLTQSEVAGLAGLRRATYLQLEAGDGSGLSEVQARRLAAAVKVTDAEFAAVLARTRVRAEPVGSSG